MLVCAFLGWVNVTNSALYIAVYTTSLPTLAGKLSRAIKGLIKNSSWRLLTENNSQECYYRELYSELCFTQPNVPSPKIFKPTARARVRWLVDTFSSSAAAAAQMHIYIARVILSAETCLEWGWCSQSQFWHIYRLWVSASARNSKTKGGQRINWLALV